MNCVPPGVILPAIIGNRFKPRRIPLPGQPDQYCHCTCPPTPETPAVNPLFERIGDENRSTNRVLTSDDTGKLFICEGAVSFTLPAAAADLQYTIVQTVNNDVSAQDGNSAIVAKNNANATQVAYSTANSKIGSAFSLVAIQLADTTYKWMFFAHCNHAVTVT